MVTALAVLAALCFSIAGYFTKLSRGLTVLGPSVMMFGLFAVGSALQALAMRHESMALTYAFVLGLEAVLAFVFSVWLLGESASTVRIGGLFFVMSASSCSRQARPSRGGGASGRRRTVSV